MQRDMKLVREILLSVRARTDIGKKPVLLEAFNRDVLDRHVEMLVNAGFLEGHRQGPGRLHQNEMVVTDMSWAGHDFLSVIDNKGVWKQIKKAFTPEELAGLPLDVVKGVGIGLLAKWAKEKVGLG